MIKKFDEFVNEGLFGAFKARNQIVKLQGAVVDEYEKMIENDPKKFKSASDLLKAVEGFAQQTYKKIVTSEDAMSFNQWWEDFVKAQLYMLDKTVFAGKDGDDKNNDHKKEDDEVDDFYDEYK